MSMTMAAFSGIAWYIAIELNIRLFYLFKRRKGTAIHEGPTQTHTLALTFLQRRHLLLGLRPVLMGNPSAPTCYSSCRLLGHQRYPSVNTAYICHLVDYDNGFLRSHVVATASHNAEQQISTMGSIHDYLHDPMYLHPEYGDRAHVGKATIHLCHPTLPNDQAATTNTSWEAPRAPLQHLEQDRKCNLANSGINHIAAIHLVHPQKLGYHVSLSRYP